MDISKLLLYSAASQCLGGSFAFRNLKIPTFFIYLSTVVWESLPISFAHKYGHAPSNRSNFEHPYGKPSESNKNANLYFSLAMRPPFLLL